MAPFSPICFKVLRKSLKNIDTVIRGYEKYLSKYNDDIGKKIVWVLSNKEKAKKIGEMGRKFVVDKLDLQKIV